MNQTRTFGRRGASVRNGDRNSGIDLPLVAVCALLAAAFEMSPLCVSGGGVATAMAQSSEIYIRLGELGVIALFYVFGRDVGAYRNREYRARLVMKPHDRPPLAERGIRKILTRLEMRLYLFTRSDKHKV